jgi:GTP-binding protein
MKVKKAVFVKSATNPCDYPRQEHPEIAFAGRSNVGKSSLINCLVHRSGLAKTSSTPGKTQLLNFFLVNSALSFVDLPGYGFAKLPERIRRRWGSMVETYLKRRESLRLVVLLVDVRRRPTEQDLQLMEWLHHHHIASITVITKVDKISRSKRQRQIQEIKQSLGEYEGKIIPFSATTREGKALVWEEIMRACGEQSGPKGKTHPPTPENTRSRTLGRADIEERKNDQSSPPR